MATVIERSGENWQLVVDGSHAPDYVLVTVHGEADRELLARYLADLTATMDGIVGAGRRFCPLVIDASQVITASINVSDISGIGANFLRRHDRTIVILNRGEGDSQILEWLVQMLGALIPKMKVARSIDDALEQLRAHL